MAVTADFPILGPDPRSGMPAYRGRDLVSLRGEPFERVWGLLVHGDPASPLPPAEPYSLPVRTGDVRADVQSALGHLGPVWAFRPILDVPPAQAAADLARASVLALSLVAQAARGPDLPVIPQREVERATTITERFLTRWKGEVDPGLVDALDTMWLLVAEQGRVASTEVARLVASTGADAAACLSAAAAAVAGPLAAGASARCLTLLRRAEELDDVDAAIAEHLPTPRHTHTSGFVPAPAADTHAARTACEDAQARARIMHAACARADARLLDVAEATERSAVEMLTERGVPVAGANMMFWAAVLLDHHGVPARLFSALGVCGRTAGWSAHVLDVQRTMV